MGPLAAVRYPDRCESAGQALSRIPDARAGRPAQRKSNPIMAEEGDVLTNLDADPAAGIGRQILPGGAYAVHTHVGPYDQMGDIISKLRTSLVQKRGLTVDYDRSFMTIYLNDPALTREMHRRTELCIPVLPIRMPLSVNDDHEADIVEVESVAG